LLNIIEQTVILCRTSEIGIEQLPAFFDSGAKPEHKETSSHGQLSRETIAELLARYKGNRSQVARELGVDRTTLWRWMKRFNLADQ
jgi:transcriptional regulator of acetoin/glycerol metabolism